jgi:beta-phosphoglucomutase-like phosphatase (HAD superfamily)/predicted kinase
MKKKIIFLDGDGTLWYPKKTKRTEKPHWIYDHPETKDNYLEHLELTPDTKETLEKLKDLGVYLVVISANPRAEHMAVPEIKERLEHFGLTSFFYSVRSSLGSDPKGKAEVMLDVLNTIGLGKEGALMIGDSFVYDYLAAKEVGIDALWIENSVSKLPEVMPTDLKSIKELSDVFKWICPTVYLLCGLPGSGKSTWSEKFVKENPNTVWYKLDKEFFEKHGRDYDGTKFLEFEEKLKGEIIEKMKLDILNSKDVILDFGFWKKVDRDKYKQLIESLNAIPKLLYFKNDNKVLMERLLERNKLKHEYEHVISEELFNIFLTRFEEPKDEGEILV